MLVFALLFEHHAIPCTPCFPCADPGFSSGGGGGQSDKKLLLLICYALSRCIWPPGTIGSLQYNITQSTLTLDTLCACVVTTDLILTEPISALDELHKCTQHFSLTLNAQILNVSCQHPQIDIPN